MNLQGGLPFDAELVTDPLREQSSYRPIRTRAKRVRDISRQVNNRLRDEAKADKAAGRETKPQKVHRCLMACTLKYGQPPTPAELVFFMFDRKEIPRNNVNLVSPRLSEGINGKVKKLKDGSKTRVGGGLYQLMPLRKCRITGEMAHPVRVPEVGRREQ